MPAQKPTTKIVPRTYQWLAFSRENHAVKRTPQVSFGGITICCLADGNHRSNAKRVLVTAQFLEQRVQTVNHWLPIDVGVGNPAAIADAIRLGR
jgi:hypothetical protein